MDIWILAHTIHGICKRLLDHPYTGANLATITIWEMIDGGMWLYYDNMEDIFWIGVQMGPMSAAVYGPYQGILWILINIINPLALIGIAISIMTLLYPLIRRVLLKEHARNLQQSL